VAVRDSLACLLDSLLAGGRHVEDVAAAVFGFAGAGRPEDIAAMTAVVRDAGLAGRVCVTSDARVAHHGALDGADGLLVIGGTGSMCYGRDTAGNESRAGGWGHVLDDVGGAYDLGLSSLREAVQQADGRSPRTDWAGAVLRAASTDVDGLIRWTGEATKQDVAALAPVALEAAAQGDEAALRLARRAAVDLASLAVAAASGLELGRRPAVALTGGLLLNDEFYRELVVDALRRAYPIARAQAPIHDAAWGAALMARDLLAEIEPNE